MYTYIIIDDERLIRLGFISRVSEITSEEFVCIGEAANGEEGLVLLEEQQPDIVITDMKMAKMDGVEFLQHLEEQQSGIPVIVISGYKAYDYMNQAIECGVVGYVLKPFSVEEIEKQLLKAVTRLEQRKSVEQMKEKVVSFEERTEGIAFLKLILEPWNAENEELGQYVLDHWHILISIYTNAPDGMNRLRECAKKSLVNIHYLCLENPGMHGQYLVFISTKEEHDILHASKEAIEFLEDMKRMTRGKKLFAVVGSEFHGLSLVNRSCQKNEKILRDVYLTDQVRIYCEKDYKSMCRRIFAEDEIQDIMVHIKYDVEERRRLLQVFFQRFDIQRDSLLEIGATCQKLLAKVDEWAVQNQVETDDIMNIFYCRYRFCDNLEKMEKEIFGYINLIALSISRRSYGDDYLYEKIVAYIQENYYKKITLQILSDQFYVSASRCSNLLRERMKKGLNTYLLELRVEKAKELLDNTTMNAEIISREVGYSNPKYFFRMFKQETSLTPIEYRKRRS